MKWLQVIHNFIRCKFTCLLVHPGFPFKSRSCFTSIFLHKVDYFTPYLKSQLLLLRVQTGTPLDQEKKMWKPKSSYYGIKYLSYSSRQFLDISGIVQLVFIQHTPWEMKFMLKLTTISNRLKPTYTVKNVLRNYTLALHHVCMLFKS